MCPRLWGLHQGSIWFSHSHEGKSGAWAPGSTRGWSHRRGVQGQWRGRGLPRCGRQEPAGRPCQALWRGAAPSRGSLHGGGGNWLERGVGPARQWSWPDVHHRWAERERRGWSWEGSESQGNMEHSWASRSGLHPPSPTQGGMGSRCASWEGGAVRRELSAFSAATLGAWPRTTESLPGLASPWDAAPVRTVGAL